MTATEQPGAALARLLELQALDERIDQLRYQIEHHPARVALNELHARHRKIAEQAGPLEARVAEFDARQAELEREIGESDARVKAIEQRLRAGTAGSYRDEGAMSTEIDSLRRRKSALEDDELEVMEAREPVDDELTTLRAQEAATEAEARARHGELTEAEAALTSQVDELKPQRDAVAGAIDAALLNDYERLRGRLGGVGLARLEHGNCSGCNLALPAQELDRITHAAPGAIFHCEQCGRILVP